MSDATSERARIASLSRSRTQDDPDLISARQRLRVANLADHVRRVVDQAPPLTGEQLDTIGQILRNAPRAVEKP